MVYFILLSKCYAKKTLFSTVMEDEHITYFVEY